MRWITLAVLSCAILTGCTGHGVPGVYGNYCGRGRPDVSDLNSVEQIEARFASIEPFDYVDCGCREHDLCYARLGKDKVACDAMFDYIVDERKLTPWCRNITSDIGVYFDYAHPSDGNWAKSIVYGTFALPTRALMLPLDALAYGSAQASGDLGRQCLADSKRITSWQEERERVRNSAFMQALIKVDEDNDRAAFDRLQADTQRGRCGAWLLLGFYYEDGRIVEHSVKKAIESYKKADACGDAGGTYMIGQHTLKGDLPGGERAAFSEFKRCMDRSHECRVMAEMLEYKAKYIDPKFLKDGADVPQQCRGLGQSGWLRRWSSVGPSLIR
jgi:hypothetical protein